MGTQIDDIVNVTISRETARVTQAGFGTPLIMGPHSRTSSRVATYSEPADLLDDNFESTDDIYIAAVKLFQQDLSPQSFKVGRKQTDVNDLQTITFDALATGGTFTVTVGSYTTAAIAYNATTATIETAIELLTGVSSVTVVGTADASTTMTIEFDGADAATQFATISVDVSSLTSVTTATVVHTQWGQATETWTAGLNAIIAADSDWYALIATTRTKSEILELAAIIETQIKIYGTCTGEADVINGVAANTLKSLKALSYDRTFYLYSADYANFPEAAWLGGQLPNNPGSITWKFKTLTGITADTLTASNLVVLKADYGNFFESVGGSSIITSDAVVVSNEYIDVIRGVDWIQVRTTEDVYAMLINNKKIPYTDKGIQAIASTIRARLEIAADSSHNIITSDSIVVNAPLVADVSSTDKANRTLNDVTFSATLQGAIHLINIAGKVSV